MRTRIRTQVCVCFHFATYECSALRALRGPARHNLVTAVDRHHNQRAAAHLQTWGPRINTTVILFLIISIVSGQAYGSSSGKCNMRGTAKVLPTLSTLQQDARVAVVPFSGETVSRLTTPAGQTACAAPGRHLVIITAILVVQSHYNMEFRAV